VTHRCDPGMRPVTNVNRRGAVYYFRRRVPANLQSIIGKSVIRESLETRELAEARRLAADRNLHWERQFEAAQSRRATPPLRPNATNVRTVRDDLSEEEFQTIVASYRRHLLAADEWVRLHGLALSGAIHWPFDRRLISVSDDYRLLVSHNKVPRDLQQLFANQLDRIRLPSRDSDWPNPSYLRRHRDAAML
jgi:hypothetical protein